MLKEKKFRRRRRKKWPMMERNRGDQRFPCWKKGIASVERKVEEKIKGREKESVEGGFDREKSLERYSSSVCFSSHEAKEEESFVLTKIPGTTLVYRNP